MTEHNWNDHPILIIGGAFLSGLGVALSVAVPVYTTYQQNAFNEKSELQQSAFDAKLKEIEERYARDKAQIDQIEQFRKENRELRQTTSSAMRELYESSTRNPIDKVSLIPRGLETIRVGKPFDNVKVLFPDAKIENDYSFINLKNGFFDKLQIGVDGNKIDSVSYYVKDNNLEKQRLLAAVTATLGKPNSHAEGPHHQPIYLWTRGNLQISVYGNQYSPQ